MTVVENEKATPTIAAEPSDASEAGRQCVSDAGRLDSTIRMILKQAPQNRQSAIAALMLFVAQTRDHANRKRPDEEVEKAFAELRMQANGDATPTKAIAVLRAAKLPAKLMISIIDAVHEDQHARRYATWESLHDWADRLGSAIVDAAHTLIIGRSAPSNTFGAALVLTRVLQNVRHDLLHRDHLYLPSEWTIVEEFESSLRRSAAIGHGVDQKILGESREAIRSCAERIWPLYMQAESFVVSLPKESIPIFEIALGAGAQMLRMIELWNYETALHRPTLTPMMRVSLRSRVWLRARGILSREASNTDQQ